MNELTEFLMSHGGAVLFVMVFVEQAGVPLPSAPWLLAAGVLSASGKMNPALAIVAAALACVLADWIWFFVGRRGGRRVLRWFCKLSLAPNACVGRTTNLFERHGLQGLVAAKFLPGLGAVMPPLAGALGVSTGRFLLFDSLGSVLYGTVYVSAGALFHNQIQNVMLVLNELGIGALLVASVLVPGYLAFKYFRRTAATRRKKTEDLSRAVANESLATRAPVAESGGQILVDALERTESPQVTVVFTSANSQPNPANATTTLAQPTLCSL